MKPDQEAEWLLRWVPELQDDAIDEGIWKLQRGSKNLIRYAFIDADGGECLATIFGAHHPALKDSIYPGPDFLQMIGLPERSLIVSAWDNDPRFAEQILHALKLERRFRKGVRREAARCRV